MTQAELQAEALARARSEQSAANYAAIFEGFTARGIPEAEIRPRENVFTFHAWKALGRSVRKGEHGVRITTWIPLPPAKNAPADAKPRLRPRTAYVFHVSQTDPIAER